LEGGQKPGCTGYPVCNINAPTFWLSALNISQPGLTGYPVHKMHLLFGYNSLTISQPGLLAWQPWPIGAKEKMNSNELLKLIK